MVFTVTKLLSSSKDRELNAFRNAESGNKNNDKIWTKMNAAFGTRQGKASRSGKFLAPAMHVTASIRFRKKQTAKKFEKYNEIEDDFRNLDLSTKAHKMGDCAPIVSGISPDESILQKNFEGDRPSIDLTRKPKRQPESSWSSQKGRAISDLARCLIAGVKDHVSPRRPLPKTSSRRTVTSVGSFAEYDYDDLHSLCSSSQFYSRPRSSSCVSPWDTPRNSTDKGSDGRDDEVFYDALPKTDYSWTEKEKRVVSDLACSPISSIHVDGNMTALAAYAKKNKTRAKTSLEASDPILDDSIWDSPEFTQIVSPRISFDSTISAESFDGDDVSPWFTSLH